MTPADQQAASADPFAAAARALGYSEMRARILHVAFRDDTCTASMLMRELGLSRGGIAVHVRPLVAAGLLVAEQDPDAAGKAGGGSNRLRWRINPEAFDAAVEEYRRRIRGESDPH